MPGKTLIFLIFLLNFADSESKFDRVVEEKEKVLLPNEDPFVIFRFGEYFPNLREDGEASRTAKNAILNEGLETLKLENEPKSTDFEDMDLLIPPIGVAPKFTGRFTKDFPSSRGMEISKDQGPITNPAAYFLEGADFSKIPTPKCQLVGCRGPVPNDGSIDISKIDSNQSSTCSQVIVPLNGCLMGRGYPIGLLCQLCCDCSNSLLMEIKKSRGYRDDYRE